MSTTFAPYLFDPPPLPSRDVSRRIIETSNTLRVRGRVASIAGDCIEIEGMTVPIGAICRIESDGGVVPGQVVGFHGVRPVLAPLRTVVGVSAGDSVYLLQSKATVRIGPALCGRVIDALGQPIDGKPLPAGLVPTLIDKPAPPSMNRPPIDAPLQTGVRGIDTMLTCGRGQRLGIFSGSGVGKSTLMGMLARGTQADRIVIAMVGERGREVQEFIQRSLGEAGLQRSIVVVATSDEPAAARVAAARTATAIAEGFRDAGEDVLLLFDSVTRFAMAAREMGLAAGEPPTTRGYPPSVFNWLPRLVERTGRTLTGSITAFYTVLVEGDDTNEPVADTLRGLLDGHIMLSRDLAAHSHWPPIDIPASLSRVQPHLIAPEVAAAVAAARRHIATHRRSADLISIGAYRAGSDPEIDAAIAMRPILNQILTQAADEMTPIETAQAALVAAMKQTAAPT